jgi:predicted ATPase/class 3 adenylate cyclase
MVSYLRYLDAFAKRAITVCCGPTPGRDGIPVAAMGQISEWLKKLGMSEYAEKFSENDIDMAVLPDLTDQHLKDLGVSLGHRLRMLRAIREFGDTPVAGMAPSASLTTETAGRDEAERRQLTIMFCDLVGSTALSGRLDPEDLRGVISAYHSCCSDLVEHHGGFVAKYMGDGVLAYFGYPQAHEHDAERAVRAGLRLVEAIPKLVTNAGSPLQARVGIATGLVVVGDLIGRGAAQEQAVVGETPNLAARLQALAEPGTVVIASATQGLIGRLFEYRDLGAVALKGFADEVLAWQVLGTGAAESRFEALRATTTPLIGRDEEIDLLLRRWEQAKCSEGQVVLISGEPGIGKSRITQIIAERLSAEPHTRLRYFCSPHYQESALYPIVAQLERTAGFRREDTAEQRLEKLEAVLAQGTNDLQRIVPPLADLLSLPTGDRYLPVNLTPQKRKEKTLQALGALIESIAVHHPVLIVLEDVHWSDPTTRELLDLLIDQTPSLRVLLVVTFRPEFNPPWVGRSHVTFHTLNRLPPKQQTEMIVKVTGGKALPKEIINQIVDRTDGVPLFIEELTKTVIESGFVVDMGDHFSATGSVAPLAIPTSLQASLLARLDRLAPTREIAQIGAALGRTFSHELLAAVAQMPQKQLDDALAQLVKAQLIFQRGTPPFSEYTFKHALVQDAAYSTLLRSRRQQLHGRIAAILESKFPDTVAATPEILAQHYTVAANAAQAVPFWLKAGQAALNRSTLAEAIGHLTKGIGLVQGIPDETVRTELELALQATLAVGLAGAKGFAVPEVEQAYARARFLCDQIGKNQQIFPVLYGQFLFHWVRANLETARRGAEEMLSIAIELGDRALQLIAHFSLGGVLWHIGDNRSSLNHLAEAIARYDEKIDPSLISEYGQDFGVWTLSYLEHAHLSLGYPERGSRAIADAVALARRLNHPLSLCNALNFSSLSNINRRDPALVLKSTEETLAIATEQGFPQYIALASFNRGWAIAQLGAVDEGIELVRQGIAMWHMIGASVSLPGILGSLAESQLLGGRTRAALETTDEALTWAERSNERVWDCPLHSCRGRIFWAMGEAGRAQEEFQVALSAARRQENRHQELLAATGLARLWGDQGKRSEARDLLEPAYNFFTEGFDTPFMRDARTLLDQLA